MSWRAIVLNVPVGIFISDVTWCFLVIAGLQWRIVWLQWHVDWLHCHHARLL
jgi:hypothetical protein